MAKYAFDIYDPITLTSSGKKQLIQLLRENMQQSPIPKLGFVPGWQTRIPNLVTVDASAKVDAWFC